MERHPRSQWASALARVGAPANTRSLALLPDSYDIVGWGKSWVDALYQSERWYRSTAGRYKPAALAAWQRTLTTVKLVEDE